VDSVFKRSINHDVRTDGKSVDIVTEIRPGLSDPRLTGVSFAGFANAKNGSSRCLRAFQRSSDVIEDSLKVGDSDIVEHNAGHRVRPMLVGDSFARESFTTATYDILGVEWHARLTSFETVERGLKFLLEPIEIVLICAEGLDAFLGRKIDRPFLNLLAQELVERFDLAARVGGHRSASSPVSSHSN
jgi:hypothetical protein